VEDRPGTAETDVPKGEWGRFCAEFSDRHHGWLVSVESAVGRQPSGPNAPRETPGGHLLADKVPLEEVEFDERQPPGTVTVTVLEPDGAVRHTLSDPAAIRLEKTTDGADRGLAIGAASGEMVRVGFQTPHFLPDQGAPPPEPDQAVTEAGRSAGSGPL